MDQNVLTAEGLERHITNLTLAIQEYQYSKTISIEVDADTQIREISDAMFGINHRYHNNGYGSWNAQTQTIEPEFDRLVKEASFGSIRYPGGKFI